MKLSIKQLASVLATYVDENKISVATSTETRDNIALWIMRSCS